MGKNGKLVLAGHNSSLEREGPRMSSKAMEARIDHLVIAAKSLEEGSEYLFDILGVRPQEGGEHAVQATHNRVLRLGRSCYLEVLAVNPNAPKPPRPRWFALDSGEMQERLRRKPVLCNWAVRTDRIEELSGRSILPLGPVTPMSRGNLRWRLTLAEDGRLQRGGIIPFLIEWDEAVHPASRMTDSGCSLVELRGFHSQTEEISAELRALGADRLISLEPVPSRGDHHLEALIRTPGGVKTLC